MISFIEAFNRVMDHPVSFGTETVNIKDAEGRILAEDIYTDREYPPFNRATKDGIAIVERIMGKKARFVMKPKRPGDQLHTRANIDKARSILGYEPHTSLEEVLRTQITWYREKIFSQALHKLTP